MHRINIKFIETPIKKINVKKGKTMSNLDFILYENLQFIDYMIQNDYDKDVISDYIKYNLDMIQNAKDVIYKDYQDAKIEKLKEEQSHRLDNLVSGGLNENQ